MENTDNHDDNQAQGQVSRRGVLKRMLGLGLSVPFAAGLLAACGSDDDESDETPAVSEPDPTGAETDAEPTETESEEPDPTTEDADDVATDDEDADSGIQPAGVDPLTMGKELEEAQNEGGTVIEGWASDLEGLNPLFISSGPTDAFHSLIFESMFVPHPETVETVGQLAEGWAVSDDATVWEIRLRDGITWQDGESFTAGDVKFTFDRIMDDETRSLRAGNTLAKVESVEQTGDLDITFTLTRGIADFPLDLGITRIIAEHIWTDVAPADMISHPGTTGTDPAMVVGTGPFLYDNWVSEEQATAVRNENYWGGAPHLDEYIYKVVQNHASAVVQLLAGEIDVYSRVPAASAPDFDGSDVELVETSTLNVSAYGTNLDPEKTTLFQDKEVRKALLLALDREAMVEAIRFGYGQVAIGTMPPLSWAYNLDAIDEELHYAYNPDLAMELLDEAGWVIGRDGVREKDGQRLAFTMWTASGNDEYMGYQVAMQEYWRQIGVEMTPQIEPLATLVERLSVTHDFETFVISLGFGLTPDQTNSFACASYESGFNITRYCNPDVDALLAEASGEPDQERRLELYAEYQNILLDDLPVAGIDFEPMLTAVNMRVHNLFPTAAGVARKYNSQTWWVDA